MNKLVVSLLLIISGCGGAPLAAGSDSTGAGNDAIQGGAVDDKDPAVGLVWIRGGGFCTGALVAPNVVLTAGHCVESAVSAFYTGEGKGTTEVGKLPVSGFVSHRVIDQVAHPSYQSADQCPNPTYDVALLRLASPLSGVTPLVVGEKAPRAGAVCRAVGYGVHGSGDSVTVEQKRSGSETVESLASTAVHVDKKSAIVDHGDSGGPLLCGDKIVAVTSCGNNANDPDHTDAWYGRVDGVTDWIAQTVAAWN